LRHDPHAVNAACARGSPNGFLSTNKWPAATFKPITRLVRVLFPAVWGAGCAEGAAGLLLVAICASPKHRSLDLPLYMAVELMEFFLGLAISTSCFHAPKFGFSAVTPAAFCALVRSAALKTLFLGPFCCLCSPAEGLCFSIPGLECQVSLNFGQRQSDYGSCGDCITLSCHLEWP
jgi:hypothetical protein